MEKKKKIKPKKLRWVPLKSTVMTTSIIGLLFTLYFWNKLGIDWGTTFFLIFVTMFVASFIAMEKAPIVE